MDRADAYAAIEDVGGNTVATVSFTNADQRVRVLAVDQEGQEHSTSNSERSVIGNVVQLSFTFEKLPIKQIKAFRFQARPYYRVEFRNVALQPGNETDAGPPRN
jgi:hypothetical protein